MKTNKNLFFLLFILLTTVSCKKNNDIKISDDNLTACEENATCSYLFTENADLNENYSLKEGSYRLFFADYNSLVGMQRTLIIKAPMRGSNFQMNEKAIKDGAVIYKFVCPTCNTINYKPIGGSVKGINTTPDKPADQTKWLIEASIVLGGDQNESGDQKLKDTVYIKQFFYPNFAID